MPAVPEECDKCRVMSERTGWSQVPGGSWAQLRGSRWGGDTNLFAPPEGLRIQKMWLLHRRGTQLMQEKIS